MIHDILNVHKPYQLGVHVQCDGHTDFLPRTDRYNSAIDFDLAVKEHYVGKEEVSRHPAELWNRNHAPNAYTNMEGVSMLLDSVEWDAFAMIEVMPIIVKEVNPHDYYDLPFNLKFDSDGNAYEDEDGDGGVAIESGGVQTISRAILTEVVVAGTPDGKRKKYFRPIDYSGGFPNGVVAESNMAPPSWFDQLGAKDEGKEDLKIVSTNPRFQQLLAIKLQHTDPEVNKLCQHSFLNGFDLCSIV